MHALHHVPAECLLVARVDARRLDQLGGKLTDCLVAGILCAEVYLLADAWALLAPQSRVCSAFAGAVQWREEDGMEKVDLL